MALKSEYTYYTRILSIESNSSKIVKTFIYDLKFERSYLLVSLGKYCVDTVYFVKPFTSTNVNGKCLLHKLRKQRIHKQSLK